MPVRTQHGVGEILCRATTTVEWKIKDYFGFPQAAGHRLESPPFSFLDAKWCLRLYPGGENRDESSNSISLYLIKKESVMSSITVQYRIQIMKQDESKINDNLIEYTFAENGTSRGWSNCLKLSELNQKKNEFAPEDILTVVCSITSNIPKSVHAAVQTETPLGIKSIVEDFKSLLTNAEGTDTILNVKNHEYKVHRAVLIARSAVFAAMMKNEWMEASNGVILIEDCDPDVFQEFLTYLYTGSVNNLSVDNVFSLHYIADKYQIHDLKVLCVEFMGDNLTINIFHDVVSLSLRHNESKLQGKAIAFLGLNLRNILITPKWLSFNIDNPAKANELVVKALDYQEKSK